MNILNLKLWKTGLLAGLTLAGLLHAEMAGAANTRTVTTLADETDGSDNVLSLREAIAASAAGDSIIFAVPGMITLTNELAIGRDLTISGPDQYTLIVSGNNASRVLNISGGTVNISNLTISNGRAVGANGADGNDLHIDGLPGDDIQGGGILNSGTLALTNCTISSNIAAGGNGGRGFCAGPVGIAGIGGSGNGGGIHNQGTLSLANCTLSGNSAVGGNGGPGADCGGLSSNPGNGGSGNGGGIYNRGTLSLANCTLSGGSAVGGYGASSATLFGTGGDGGNGTGGGLFQLSDLGYTSIRNTIIADDNVSGGAGGANGAVIGGTGSNGTGTGPDVSGSVGLGLAGSQGHNLIGAIDDSSGWVASDLTGTVFAHLDPQLGPLQDNGGPTLTMALLPTSAAIDAGDDSVTNSLSADQRGYPRQTGAHVDIGAYEVGPPLVINTNDNGVGSLRDAILVAAPGETVTFAPNVTGTITLTTGELAFGKNVNINGPGAKVLTVSGNNASRVFHVTSGASQISNLRIADGHASDGGGGVAVEGDSSLTVTGCAVNNCYADGSGLFADGGGGIYVGPVTLTGSPTLSLNACTLSGNSSRYYGGGLLMFNAANVSLLNCTVSGNSTLDNSFGEATGGGIYVQSTTLNITSSTVANNSSVGNGGGIYRVNGTVTIGNSLIAGNTALAGPDCSGQLNKGLFTSAGYNLIGKTNGSIGFSTTSHDQVGSIASPLNPLIGPLQDNGGPTLTHALLGGSPAIDKGKSFGVTTDQRGSVRPYDDGSIPNASGGEGSDIGAFEAQAPSGPLLTIARSGTGVAIAWPSPSTGFVLQQNTSGLSSANWSTVLTTPNDDGTTKTIIVDPATGDQYFRLLHQ